jgi:ABC-type uncharacterized transport system permease subunit
MSSNRLVALEPILLPLGALICALALFALFLALQGYPALEAIGLIYKGAYSNAFAWQNTLQRASPLMLTALCVALPARAGLTIIGGEGALALGALAAAVVPMAVPGLSPMPTLFLMALAGFVAGGVWIGIAGGLRHYRGVNETISSLLLSYIGIAIFNHLVEGPLRDPGSLNKPSTPPLAETLMIGSMPGIDVHWGFVYGIVACIIAWLLLRHSLIGFAIGVVGGNVRAAQMAGLPVGPLLLLSCFLGGGSAGLAGMIEVAAVQGSANASLLAGYGYAGILVSFVARHHPLGIIVCSVLLGGIGSSGSLLQRRLDLPDATVMVLQGILFVVILGFETFSGRIKFLQPKAT